MKKLLLFLGLVAFWLAWPLLWIYLRFSKRTRILVVCKDEFLVVRGWLGTGQWALPGGGLHINEDPEQGVLRELKEETGIELMPSEIEFLYSGDCTEYGLKTTYQCFAAKLKTKPVIRRQRLEIADIKWRSLADTTVLTRDAKASLAWWHKH